jgi:ankyrin repeat protein
MARPGALSGLLVAASFSIVVWQSGCAGNRDEALIESAAQGNASALRSALKTGADTNARDEEFGATALCFAAAHGDADAVRALVQAGSDVNAKGQCGSMTVMGDLTTDDPVLIYAAARGGSAAIPVLLQSGSRVNEPGTLGTPLILAAYAGDLAAVQLLLKGGADPSCKDPSGETAEQAAKSAGHLEIAELLSRSAKR